MFRGMMFGLVIAAAVPAAAAAKDKPLEVLKRTGPWQARYDDDACHLLAQFGDAKDPVIMRITTYEPGDWFTLGLYGRRVATTDVRSKAQVDFGLKGTPIERETINGSAGPFKAMWLSSLRLDGWVRSSPDEVAPVLTSEQHAAVTGVTVTVERHKPFRLESGSMAKPMAQLRACQRDLVKSWGYDPEVQASLQRPARPSEGAPQWITYRDYPEAALRMGHNGVVQFRLDVDAQGKVGGCYVLDRTKPDNFADVTCDTVKRRAKLEPALDAQGKPVRSFYVQRVTWRVGT